MADQPNIILIMADQWRHDGLSVLGNPVAQTPHLDKLANDGAIFTHAYSAVPSCIPARAALMTGQHQRHHGRVGYMDNIPWTYPVTMGSVFSDAGYHTQAIGKMHVAPARNLVGFHNVVLHDGYLHWNRRRNPSFTADDDYLCDLRQKYGPAADYIDSGIGCNGYVVNPWPYDIMLHPTAWITTQSIDFLRRRDPGKPFFLKVSYHRPHPPLDPPQTYYDMYRDVKLPPLPKGDWVGRQGLPGIEKFLSTPESPFLLNDASIDRARRAYYAQCTFIDHQINRLIMALVEHGVWNNTAIVFTADHGDMLYDHELMSKALPYENSAGIPFIVRPPLNQGIKGGVRLEQPVELRDVLPTLCDIAGIPIPEEVDGVSVMPLIRGEQPEWRLWLHGEHVRELLSNHWLTDGKMKYSWYSQTGAEQLFDLQEDPQECCDLVYKRPEELVKWRNRLMEELRGREEQFVQDGQLVVGRPVSPLLKEAGLPDALPLPAYLR